MDLLTLRDVDSVTRARWVQAFGWGAFPGLFVGFAVAVPLSETLGWWGFLICPLVLTGAIGGVALLLGESVGNVVAVVAHPRGAPVPPDYSLADAHLLRGDVEAGIAALQEEAGRHPTDPEPCLRLGRVFRDELNQTVEALAWFRAARDAKGASSARSAAVSREIAELLRSRNDLAGALTELARLAELHPDTPAGRWAVAERAHLKALRAARPGD